MTAQSSDFSYFLLISFEDLKLLALSYLLRTSHFVCANYMPLKRSETYEAGYLSDLCRVQVKCYNCFTTDAVNSLNYLI